MATIKAIKGRAFLCSDNDYQRYPITARKDQDVLLVSSCLGLRTVAGQLFNRPISKSDTSVDRFDKPGIGRLPLAPSVTHSVDSRSMSPLVFNA
tara:strand:- start:1179 stop:1460 length:282 start_codon:yes stop_codon:yes gene_type:complete